MTRHLIASLVLACVPGIAHAVTAEELIAKNLEARGGAAKLAAITSMHTMGTTRTFGGAEAKTESWIVDQEKYRSELTLQGMTAISSWDGNEAWRVQPFRGRKEPALIAPDDAKPLVEAADIAGPLSEYQKKGSKVEYLGTEDVDGTDAHKLRVTQKNGDTQYVYLDPDHFLEIRIIAKRMVRGQEETSTTELGEYEKVDGLYFPFEINRTRLDKVELNVPIEPGKFSMPKGGSR